ncbi:ATP-binding protein [Streptomyces sp. NPDC101062]|uniref:ATP-binding protein n=1 Tax=unclassified Streptomyces TaxID=2593676 RepID=UPI002E783A3C|nr:ATP-binding protein [Streptomyces sp. JV176]MEE1800463.1 ATP-binding protein [Streptomyces sp. JV176]
MTRRIAPLPHRHVLTLPAKPGAVRTARETTQQLLAEWGISPHHPAVDPALLILSELVTNSVRHAASVSPSLTVSYAAGHDTLVFAVHDRHPYQPTLRTPAPGTDPGSGAACKGLATVVELTSSLAGSAVVRQDGDGGGKSICITLPL